MVLNKLILVFQTCMNARVLPFSTSPSSKIDSWLKDGQWLCLAKALDSGLSLHLSWKEGDTLWKRILIYAGQSLVNLSSVQALNQRTLIRQCLNRHDFSEEDLILGIVQSAYCARPDFLELFLEYFPGKIQKIASSVFQMLLFRKPMEQKGSQFSTWEPRNACQCIQFFKKLGVDINGNEKEFYTPLQIALNKKDNDLFQALMMADANPLIKNKKGLSAWDIIWEYRDSFKIQCIMNSSWKTCVIKKEALLIKATKIGDLEFFHLFLEWSSIEQKKEAWFLAAKTNHVLILNAFLKWESHIDWLSLEDSLGNIALDWAQKTEAKTAQLWLMEKMGLISLSS